MQVNASIDESDIGGIAPKQPVTFRVDAYPNETFTGTVSQVRLQPVVEQNVVSYVTVIDVPEPGLKLKPGMTADVTIETGRADDVLKVPNAALRFRPSADAETVDAGRRADATAAASNVPSDGQAAAARLGARSGSACTACRCGPESATAADTAILDGDLTPGTRRRHRHASTSRRPRRPRRPRHRCCRVRQAVAAAARRREVGDERARPSSRFAT